MRFMRLTSPASFIVLSKSRQLRELRIRVAQDSFDLFAQRIQCVRRIYTIADGTFNVIDKSRAVPRESHAGGAESSRRLRMFGEKSMEPSCTTLKTHRGSR